MENGQRQLWYLAMDNGDCNSQEAVQFPSVATAYLLGNSSAGQKISIGRELYTTNYVCMLTLILATQRPLKAADLLEHCRYRILPHCPLFLPLPVIVVIPAQSTPKTELPSQRD